MIQINKKILVGTLAGLMMLAALGTVVLSVINNQVVVDIEGLDTRIRRCLHSLTPTPQKVPEECVEMADYGQKSSTQIPLSGQYRTSSLETFILATLSMLREFLGCTAKL